MKNITIFKNFIDNHSKKEIFLFGFYISFIALLLLSAVLDYQIQNYSDFKIEFIFAIFAFAGLIYLYVSKDIDVGINIMVILATFMTYVLSAYNGFGISNFHIIIPLSYFLLFTLKRALVYFFIHHSIVFSLYLYGTYVEQIQYNISKLIGIFIAILFVLAFGIFYHIAVEESYKKLEIINEELETANYQKEILLNEIHHRIKNSLYFISSMLGLQQRDEKDPKLTKILEKNRLRIQSIAMIHDALYKYDSFEEISFDTYTKKLCDTILELYDNKTVVTIKESNIYLSIEDTLRFGIITNELLTNSLNHAFADEAGEVTISLLKTKDSYIYKYNDNGKIAIDEKEFMKDDSLGLKIIHMMVEQMEAKMYISYDRGVGFQIVMDV
jgi:two-component sensor histidine kinase